MPPHTHARTHTHTHTHARTHAPHTTHTQFICTYDHVFPVCREDCRRVKCVHCMGVEWLWMKWIAHALRKNYLKSVQTQSRQILCSLLVSLSLIIKSIFRHQNLKNLRVISQRISESLSAHSFTQCSILFLLSCFCLSFVIFQEADRMRQFMLG